MSPDSSKAAPVTEMAGQPHVFVEQAVPGASMVAGDHSRGFVPAGPALETAAVCGLCRKPRGDRLHVEGKAEAESQSWG
jgi:hypothetical protein